MSRINRRKVVLDAAGAKPGRIATEITKYLMGKHKIGYVAYHDMGDRVDVKNADRVAFSGKKIDQKVYLHHSMHPGGLKSSPAKKEMRDNPSFVIKNAVSKMLPRNKFRTDRLRRLNFV